MLSLMPLSVGSMNEECGMSWQLRWLDGRTLRVVGWPVGLLSSVTGTRRCDVSRVTWPKSLDK